MAESHLATVRKKLQNYADRGVFRAYAEVKRSPSKTEFQFVWLEDARFNLIVDHEKGTMQLKNLLPDVTSHDFLDSDLRDFIKSRSDKSLPAHRRLDPKRGTLAYTNRKSAVSLTLTVHKNQYAYATTKILNITNELFAHLHLHHPPYLWANFDVPEE
ncbi:MAG: hypothetical protein VCD00_17585 [Candidatus Hydrogenedentota bacterium]